MRILVACEESQVVTSAFRACGYEAYSCDILPTSGAFPHWHLQCDVSTILSEPWDMILAFPPCTHLCVSGARWFHKKRETGQQQRAIDFFLGFTQLSCPYIAIENPIGIMSRLYAKPTQIIQPWQFGHGETKATCLWLKGLPMLRPTQYVWGRQQRVHKMPPSVDRGILRSKTYTGIAEAMALQWGTVLSR
jgi:hypothetical protein